MVLSVSDSIRAGVTAGTPLQDQEDRVHSHSFSLRLPLPSKHIAAVDGSDQHGGCNGDFYSSVTQTGNATSGYPFMQLSLCEYMGTASPAPQLPFGAAALFSPSTNSCPVNMSAYSTAEGRFLVPGFGVDPVPSVWPPLSQPDLLPHVHNLTSHLTLESAEFEGVDGCCNNDLAPSGSYIETATSGVAEDDLPYVSLLTCSSTLFSFDTSLPDGALMWMTAGTCPPGWSPFDFATGRFLVAVPPGAEPGVAFGGSAMAQSDANDFAPVHTHPFSGSVDVPDCGIELVEGCCSGGYATAGEVPFSGDSSSATGTLPYLLLTLCSQNA